MELSHRQRSDLLVLVLRVIKHRKESHGDGCYPYDAAAQANKKRQGTMHRYTSKSASQLAHLPIRCPSIHAILEHCIYAQQVMTSRGHG